MSYVDISVMVKQLETMRGQTQIARERAEALPEGHPMKEFSDKILEVFLATERVFADIIDALSAEGQTLQ